MAKWCGVIGYAETTQTSPGVWSESITERHYIGDLTRNTRRLENSNNVNDDVTINNEISIIADSFSYQNFHAMRYVGFMNAKWKITNVEVQHPRLILTIGGEYK